MPFTFAPSYMPKQERVFLVICSLFFGTLGVINLLGISRFIDLSFFWRQEKIGLVLPLGVLAYPILLICINVIAEIFGKKRANFIIWLGFGVNLWILAILWITGFLPPQVPLNEITHLPTLPHPDYAFFYIRKLTLGSIVASTISFLIAQMLEVHLFQYWKQKTQGKYLWLRYNISTICSQLIDTALVVSITFFLTGVLPVSPEGTTVDVGSVILSCYLFKIIITLFCLVPFYLIIFSLRAFLNTPPKGVDTTLETVRLQLIKLNN